MTQTPLEILRAHHEPKGAGKSQELFLAYGPNAAGVCISHITQRFSSHDFELDFELAQADEIQQLETVFWKLKCRAAGIPTDLIAFGPDIDEFLHPEARGNPHLWKTTAVILPLRMHLLEIIPRINLTGSAWRQYRDHEGMVYGRQYPPGLLENDPLEHMAITFTDKAPKGQHDKPQPSDEVEAANPELAPFATGIMEMIGGELATGGRARMPDTKFEVGRDSSGRIRLGDQVGTTHTSRIWDVAEAAQCVRGSRVPPHDKDFVRFELESLGIKNFEPDDPEDCVAVRDLVPSENFLKAAGELFKGTVPLLTGMNLEMAQHKFLGIPSQYFEGSAR